MTHSIVERYREDGLLKRSDFVRLDKNERVESIPEQLINSFKNKISSDLITAYPDASALYAKLARQLAVDSRELLLTLGSDGAIKACFDAFVRRGSRVLSLRPTFGMVEVYCKAFGAEYVAIDLNNDLSINIDSICNSIDASLDLIVLANPNSPTGFGIGSVDLLKIIKASSSYNIPLLIDETYFEFFGVTAISKVFDFSNVIICRTFSKGLGSAGVRVGVMISNSDLIARCENYRLMYPINSFSLLWATVVLDNYDVVAKYTQEVVETKKIIMERAEELADLKIIPSDTNFLHLAFNGYSSEFLLKELFELGYLIKPAPYIGNSTDNFIRFTVPPLDQAHDFLDAVISL